MQKMNMIIGVFFSEVGTALLKRLNPFDRNSSELQHNIVLTCGDEDELSTAYNFFKGYKPRIETKLGNLDELGSFLSAKRDFIIRLLESPNLLEHESFTDLLLEIIHLDEELDYRRDISHLSELDLKHLDNDITRVYTLLIYEWFKYMKHLKDNYSYLYCLALRINPFDPDSTAEIKDYNDIYFEHADQIT